MKLFKKSILAMMAVAVCAGFTACSDDDDYVPGSQSPGAFFSQSNPSDIEVNLEATSFTATVQRTSTAAPAAYALTLQGGDGLFSVPATVNFAENALSAEVKVSFDPAKVAQDKKYDMKIILSGASQYGSAEYEFSFMRAAPLVTKPFECGQGTFEFYNFAEGDVPGVPIYVTYNAEQPTKNVVYTLPTFGAGVFSAKGVALQIIAPDAEPNANGEYVVTVPGVFTGYSVDASHPIYVADLAWVWDFFGMPQDKDTLPSTYNVETGKFSLNLLYFVPETGNYYGDMNKYEFFQMDGYPDYSIDLVWNGFQVDTKMNMSASLTYTAGDDVESVRVACMATDDASAVVEACLGNADGVYEGAGGTVDVSFPIEKQGTYTAVAVAYDAAGAAQDYRAISFVNSLSAAEEDLSDYEDAGMIEIVDGWVVPMWSKDGVTLNALEYRYNVELLRSKSNPGEYVMVRPWGPKHPLNHLNTTPNKKCNIHIRLSNNSCVIDPQLSGFGTSSRPEFYIGNLEGYFVTKNDIPDATAIAVVAQNYPEDATTCEDGIINVALPLFNGAEGFGYSWNVVQPSVLIMDEEEVVEGVKAKKVVAKRVAKPAVRGMRAAMKDSRKHDKKALSIPRKIKGLGK